MKLFLSYNSQDRHFVKTVRDKLLAAGFSNPDELFFDSNSLIAGDNWVQKIGDALQNSDAFLCFISGNGIGKWQEKEAVTATSASTKSKTGYKIIPVVIAGGNGEIKRDLPWFLVNYQWVEFADADDAYAFEKLLNGLRSSTDGRTVINQKNPYKGLSVFETTDAPYFFGRTADVNWVFHKLNLASKKYACNFLAVVADSGVGKSSFVKAGLLSALQGGRYEGSDSWKYITVTPGTSPLDEVATKLENGKVIANFERFKREIKTNEPGTYLNSVVKVYGQKLVLFVDQFEEVITQCRDETERRLFLLNLAKATESGLLLILLTLRSDYYASFTEHPAFKEKLENNNYTLAAIDLKRQRTDGDVLTLKDIIQRPALLHGINFEPVLTDRLVNDTESVTGALPLLQLTLFKLWTDENIRDGIISLSEYDKISEGKGMEGMIEIHADDVYKKVCPDGEGSERSNLFRDVLLQLVELTESHDDVRRTVEKEKLFSGLKVYKESEVESMLNELTAGENRLLKISEKSKGKYDVDIVHEVLIRKWSKLRKWIEENRTALKEKEIIENAAAVFAGNRKKYYKISDLRNAIKWQQEHRNLSTRTIDDFIEQSKKEVLQFWLKVAGLAVTLVVFFFVLKATVYEKQQFKKKCAASQLVQNVLKNYRTDNPENVIHLLLEGYNLNDQLEYCNCFPRLDSVELEGTFDNTRLSSIEVFQGVKYLRIESNQRDTISDFSALKELKSLTSLYLSGNNLTNLSGLKELKNLTFLNLNYNNLTNLSGLKELKNLTSLYLSDNDLTNLDGLKELKNLDTLDLDNNFNLTNLDALKELKNLTYLNLSRTNLTNLDVLKGLDSLTTLDLLGIPNVTDLAGYAELKRKPRLTIHE